MGGGGADVDTDREQLDVVEVPGQRLAFLVLIRNLAVVIRELEMQRRSPPGCRRGDLVHPQRDPPLA